MSRTRTRPWRRATQLAVASVYLAIPLANARGIRDVLGSLVSTRVGPLELSEPAAALSALLAGGPALPAATLLLGAAPPAILALVLGPVFCGWICPFGLVSEGLAALRRRRPSASDAHRRVRVPRAAALAGVVAGSAAAGLPLAALLEGPRAVSVAALEILYLGAPSAFAAGALGALLLVDVAAPRLFCRALCPAGAAANYLRTPRTLRIAHDPGRCRCGEARCAAACAWWIDPRRAGRFDGCTSCLDCLDVCPSGALRAGFVPLARGVPSPPAKEIR